jgi:hypothetical protein
VAHAPNRSRCIVTGRVLQGGIASGSLVGGSGIAGRARGVRHHRFSVGSFRREIQGRTDGVGEVKQAMDIQPYVLVVKPRRAPGSRPVGPLHRKSDRPASRVLDVDVATPIVASN